MITAMGLSGTLWPIHLKPLQDELLSSWMIRLAHAHGLKVMSLCTLLFGYRRPIWNRDIDKFAPPEILEKMSQITGTPPETVFGTTLKELEGRAFEKFNPNGNTRWTLPLGIYHRKRRGFGLQFCPQCLKEDSAPYFRRAWRVGFITACTRHNLMLMDRCPSCQAPVAPHRVDMMNRTYYPGERHISRCTCCGVNLENAEITGQADSRILSAQLVWEQAINNGWIDWAGNTSMYAFLFFDGLRAICTGLTKKSDRNRLSNSLQSIQKIAKDWPVNGIEHAPVQARHALLAEVVDLLKNWPDNLLIAAKNSNLRYSSLSEYQNNLPFWYDGVLRKHLKHHPAPITHTEVDSIVNAIEFRNGRFHNHLARKLYGRDLSRHKKHYSHPPVSFDTYEQLLASIDHEIAGTLDKTRRLELLRNKVMFAVGRVLHLSISELSEITIEDVRVIMPTRVPSSFVESPTTLLQARAWAEWYFENVRPYLQPNSMETKLFTSLMTRRGLKRSAISAVFNKAVKTSHLHRSISCYSSWGY